ncbi:hypothetical protein O1Q96_16315 [Streptomyces sp. Qhu-G9]|uniref:hypothetical protein n=1 Tax=Streptomyces sp. Qhu-G9 TaxID=3452799 RepID=UPI0022AC623B|nr:hypothetical protein [Streptomyces aurantiacus]WAU81201.1 hypothetical protein O1Q96_16315 [Streptomyces aurantiacus]
MLGLPTLLLDADATSQSAYNWFKVAKTAGFDIPANLFIERHPFDDIAEYIRDKHTKFGAIVVDAGAKLFHEAVTEANRLIVPVAPTKIERRKLIATFDEAERAAARNTATSPPTSSWSRPTTAPASPAPPRTNRQGIADGAADAVQVSDRFHLWQGLSKRVSDIAAAHRACLSAAVPESEPAAPPPAELSEAVDSPARRHA